MEGDTAMERRLRALARQRRRQVEDLPRMSGMARERLRAEVGRRRERVEVGLSESVSDGPEPLPAWVGRKVWLPWLGVAAAAGAMVWMIWFPDPRGTAEVASAPGNGAYRSMAVPSVEEWSAVDGGVRQEGPAGAVSTVSRMSVPAVPLAPEAGRESAAEVVKTGDGARAQVLAKRSARGREPAPMMMAGGVRWRQTYQVTSEGEVPDFLGVFECVRSGDRLELRAADGTIFRGRVTELREGVGQREGWVYEAQGQPLGWGSEVAISLQWDRPEGGGEGGYLALPLRATLVWGGTNVVDLRAEPSGDG